MKRAVPSTRTPPRRTALRAAAIFVPLAAALLWWAFANRVVKPDPNLFKDPPEGRLFAPWGVACALFAAAGPAVLVALYLGNRHRLKAVFRHSRGRWIAASILALLTPFWNLDGFPMTAWMTVFTGIGVVLVPVLAAAWYPTAAVIISGIKDKYARVAVFALCWWSVYGWLLLAVGWRYP